MSIHVSACGVENCICKSNNATYDWRYPVPRTSRCVLFALGNIAYAGMREALHSRLCLAATLQIASK